MPRRLQKPSLLTLVVGAVVGAGAFVASASSAAAHQPLYLDERHSTPADGPRIVDGTISFAVYTVLPEPGATRGFRFTLGGGDPLVVELLIPNQEPERTLAARDLPVVTVTSPNGDETKLLSAVGETFDEPFTGTSYIRLAGLDSTGVAGTYGLTVTGAAPARVTMVVGRTEQPGEVDGAGADGSVAEWWASPPPGVASGASTAPASTAPASTAPALTAPASTGPGSTGPASTGSASTGPASTGPGSSAASTDVLPTPSSSAEGASEGSASSGATPASSAPDATAIDAANPAATSDETVADPISAVTSVAAPADDSALVKPRGDRATVTTEVGTVVTPYWMLWALLPLGVFVIILLRIKPGRPSAESNPPT